MLKERLKAVKQYFNLINDKEDEQQVIEQVSAGVVFRGTNLWILIFAILIASLGLNVNSTAVIIGAMLISPLMGPIIGMGLSVGIGDYELLRRALKNFAVATLISVLTAALYFLISPLNEARSELLARTSPTLYDVLIAFCGGAAGVLALTTKSKGQVIPGVAIATALMPPLCTAGYGLATAQWSYFLGAFYLFFINTVFIAVATFLGVKLLRFHSHNSLSPEAKVRGRRLVWIVVVVTMLPAAVMTVSIVKRNVFDRNMAQFVSHELTQDGTQILSQSVVGNVLRVVAVGKPITESEISEARSRMHFYGMRDYELEVIQGSDNEDVEHIVERLNKMAAEERTLNGRLSDVSAQLAVYTSMDTLSVQATREAVALFPQVEKVGVGMVGGSPTAVVTLRHGASLAAADRERLAAWLAQRTEREEIDVLVR